MRLIAQLLDYTQHTLRSMKTAQPGIKIGKNNRMSKDFFVQIVHVSDVYTVVCMQ